MDMIGRREEQEELLEAYHSGKPEFIALYGRRRVGKTFLVRSLFEKEFAFHVTGMANSGTRTQLDNFREALADYGHACGSGLTDWREAFHELRLHLEKINRKRKIVFIDEMPWMDTPRSGFLQALEHFWNGWASAQSDILMIVCGSAAAWIVKHLFKNRGGLHNRLTKRILLNPFQLKECEEYFRANGIGFTQSQVMEAYMVFGGIPYYLSLLSGKYSVVQNVDRLCFRSDGALRNEFEELYASLYKNAERHVLIVKTLGGKKKGRRAKKLSKLQKSRMAEA